MKDAWINILSKKYIYLQQTKCPIREMCFSMKRKKLKINIERPVNEMCLSTTKLNILSIDV